MLLSNEIKRLAYILDGKGGGRAIDWSDVPQWTPTQGPLWLHLNYTDEQAQQWLQQESHLDPIVVDAMLAEDLRPRSVIEENGILLFLRGVNLNPGQEPEDMVSLRIWLERHRIITTRHRRLLSIRDTINCLEQGHGPRSANELLTFLNDRLVIRMAEVLDDINDQVDAFDTNTFSDDIRTLQMGVADLRRQIILIRRYLAPQREALYQLQIDQTPLLTQVDRQHIRETTDRVMYYIEDLDAARDRTILIQDELNRRLSEKMEQGMFILSMVAVIFLPLSFITGLLGINVGGIPGADSRWGFALVCGLLVLLSVVTVWIIRRKKWI